MLRVTQIRSPEQYEKIFASFDSKKQIYLVSDLRSKKVLQESLIEREGYVETKAILRASDYWKMLIQRDFPEFQLLSYPLYQSYLDYYLCENSQSHLCADGPLRTVMEFLNQLSPLFFREDSAEIILELFELRPQIKKTWGPWEPLLAEIFLHFKNKKWLPQQWLPGFLLNQNLQESQFDRSLVVDLKHDISPAELQLMQDISRFVDVDLLVPMEAEQHKESESSFYEMFLPGHRFLHELKSENLSTRRFSSTLSEMKWLTASIRRDLENGRALDEIAILSATPELTSSLLFPLFEAEGLPLQVRQKRPALYWIEVQRWLSKLSLYESEVQSSQVEISLFSSSQKEISYKEFKKLFSRIYGPQDLHRYEPWTEQFSKWKNTDLLFRDEFVQWTLAFWEETTSSDLIVKFYKQIFEEIPVSIQFSRELWLRHMRRLMHRLELSTGLDASQDGIEVLNYSSLDHSHFKKIYVCGLSDENLRRTESHQISKGDMMSLIARYGVALNLRESNLTEKELLFDMAQTDADFELLFSESDGLGKLQNPPVFWLKLRLQEGKEIVEHEPTFLTVMDSLALQFRESLEQSQTGVSASMDNQDPLLSLLANESKCHVKIKHKRISASGLEDFGRCPYIFAAKRLFMQSDEPPISLDLDAMSEGSLMHLFLENLLKDPTREKGELLEQLKELTPLKHFSGLVWEKIKRRYVIMGQAFESFEKDFYGSRKDQIDHFVEVKAHGYIDQSTGEFYVDSRPSENEWSVSGSVDRIDRDQQGQAVILDYKKSGTELYNFDQWINKGKIQLLFYVLCAESGLLEIGAVKPVGAFYYVTRPMSRQKGGGLSDVSTPLLKFEGKFKNQFNLEGFEELKRSFRSWMQEKLQEMSENNFSPRPKELTLCDNCQWRYQCRARHLL